MRRRSSMAAVLLIPFLLACGGDDGATGVDEDGDADTGTVAAEGSRFTVAEAGDEIAMEATEYLSNGGTVNSSGTISSQLTSQWIDLTTILASDQDTDSVVVTYTGSVGSIQVRKVHGTVDTTGTFMEWDELNVLEEETLAEGESIDLVVRHPSF